MTVSYWKVKMPFTTILREEVKLDLLKHKAMMNFYYDRGIAVIDDLGTKEAEELKGRIYM